MARCGEEPCCCRNIPITLILYNNVYALNANTGAELWSYYTGGGYSSPAVANGVVYVGSAEAIYIGHMYALNASTGAVLWSHAASSGVDSSPAVTDGVVYVDEVAFNVHALNARPYNFLFLPMVDPAFGYAFDKRSNEKVLLVCPYSTHQERWLDMECVNVHDGKKYKMVDCTKEQNPDHNVVVPSQFARLLIQYQEHPEAKSLAPDGTPCKSDTKGLLKRAHIVAGELRYIGKETDRKWEEGDDISVLEFKTTEYGRSKMVVASEEVKKDIRRIGINKCARESRFDRKNFIRKLVRDIPVKRNSYAEFERWLKSYKSMIAEH